MYPEPHVQPSSDRGSQAGFSLIEMLVAMVVFVEVVTALMLLFTGMSNIARVQTDVAELQQAHRISQRELVNAVRSAGKGGLPATVRDVPAPNAGVFPDGLAFAVWNNVASGTRIAEDNDDADGDGDGGDDGEFPNEIMAGSDVLVVRGVFTTPVYYITAPQLETRDNAAGDAGSILDGLGPYRLDSGETITVFDTIHGVTEQSLQALNDALEDRPKQTLIVRDLLNPSAYGILESDGMQQDYATCGNCIEINVKLSDADDAEAYADMMQGSSQVGGYQVEIGAGRTVAFPRRIGSIGILEEHRYFIRPSPDETLATSTIPRTFLSRSSVRPGTTTQLGSVDISDNVVDLQVAVGIDRSRGCPPDCPDDGERGWVSDDSDQDDEVWYNDPLDTEHAFPSDADPGDPNIYAPRFHYVRMTTVVHSAQPERGHVSTPIGILEDQDRTLDVVLQDAGVTFSLNDDLSLFHRRVLTTTADLRNVQ